MADVAGEGLERGADGPSTPALERFERPPRVPPPLQTHPSPPVAPPRFRPRPNPRPVRAARALSASATRAPPASPGPSRRCADACAGRSGGTPGCRRPTDPVWMDRLEARHSNQAHGTHREGTDGFLASRSATATPCCDRLRPRGRTRSRSADRAASTPCCSTTGTHGVGAGRRNQGRQAPTRSGGRARLGTARRLLCHRTTGA